jgi:hypothetical protein
MDNQVVLFNRQKKASLSIGGSEDSSVYNDKPHRELLRHDTDVSLLI